jgi:hypothetical protein
MKFKINFTKVNGSKRYLGKVVKVCEGAGTDVALYFKLIHYSENTGEYYRSLAVHELYEPGLDQISSFTYKVSRIDKLIASGAWSFVDNMKICKPYDK